MKCKIIHTGLVLISLFISLPSYSNPHVKSLRLSHEASDSEFKKATQHNREYFLKAKNHNLSPLALPLERPVEEYAKYKYLLIQSDDLYGGLDKTVFAKNLPQDMKLVVLTYKGNESDVRNRFGRYLSSDRLIVATHSSAQFGFWARDAFPFPVISLNQGNSLVSHRYYRAFNGQQAIANSVRALNDSYDFVFVGGNLMADEDGNCFVVNSNRLYNTPLEVIRKAHGCKTLTDLPWVSGIGDVDEVIKLLPNKNALTNNSRIQKILESKGYKVTMLPDAGGYRTYANSLILDHTVFMPSYGTQKDEEAKSIYESFGYQIVKIDSRDLSDDGHGSVHCITMAYPEINLAQVLKEQGYSF